MADNAAIVVEVAAAASPVGVGCPLCQGLGLSAHLHKASGL